MRFHHAFALALAVGPLCAQGDVTQDPRFVRGKELFSRSFHRRDGLGAPEFNGDSCRACHRDPVTGGAGGLELNVSRFGSESGGVFTDLPGGQVASKLRPPHFELREEAAPFANVFEQRQTPTLIGVGLIDSIPANVILANEDPNDADGDGVRGVARRLDIGGTIEIGRFGWKAQVPRLLDFVRDATFGELGLTTSDDGRGFGARTDGDTVADPEFNDAAIADMAFFMAALTPPARTTQIDPVVAQGQQLFTSFGCAKCHIPALQGSDGLVPLYSDLLLHNVMPAGFRGMSENGAGMGVYRTPPLWGIKDTAPYMHDGRAENLGAAIEAHAGEAGTMALAFKQASAANQQALIAFLISL